MPARPPRRILVICLRRLGDVLLATPLIRSLRQAWPEAVIDALVFSSTAAALEGNPDLNQVIAWPARAGIRASWRLAWPLRRRYELACAVTASDRAQALAAWTAARRVVMVQTEFPRPWLNPLRIPYEPERFHTVTQGLRLATALGIAAQPRLVPPRAATTARLEALLGRSWHTRRYAVIHPAPMYRYKAWTLDGWRRLVAAQLERGLQVVLSGGPAADERALVSALVASLSAHAGSVHSVAGLLTLAELTPLLELAAVFIGPDTSVTHLAAACGTPTVALFGPSSPVAWGPWPQGWNGDAPSPWQLRAPLQRVGNVTIVQGTHDRFEQCIPCLQEGCERHLDSGSDCLELLAPERVLAAVDQALASGAQAPA